MYRKMWVQWPYLKSNGHGVWRCDSTYILCGACRKIDSFLCVSKKLTHFQVSTKENIIDQVHKIENINLWKKIVIPEEKKL